MAVVNEVSTVSHIPQFVPFGLLYYTQDTGDLYIGTGFSTGSDYVGGNPGPNVNVELISSPGGLPGGFNGDIQYNNNGNLGGSAATITASGTISIPTGQNYEINGVPLSSAWSALTGAMTYTQVAPWYNATSTVDSGISRIGAASLAIGNGTAGDFSGKVTAGIFVSNVTGSAGAYQFINANYGFTLMVGYIRFINAGSSGAAVDPNANLLVSGGGDDSGTKNGTLGFNGTSSFAAATANISWLAAGSLAIGNGTSGDESGTLTCASIAGNSSGLIVSGGSANLISIKLYGYDVGLWQVVGNTLSLTTQNNYQGTGFGAMGLRGDISTTTDPSIVLGNTNIFTGTSGTQTGITMGGLANFTLAFNPPSGTASFVGVNIAPTLAGTSSGNTTALVVNPTLTATNLTGKNLIASFQSGGSQVVSIDYSGNLSLNRVNVAGIDFAGTATITAAGTSVTVTYAANYTGAAAPVVVVTPTSDPLAAGIPVGYWVVATGVTTAWTGFTINIQTALAGNVTFNFIAIGKA
jgi:hypothetical protein